MCVCRSDVVQLDKVILQFEWAFWEDHDGSTRADDRKPAKPPDSRTKRKPSESKPQFGYFNYAALPRGKFYHFINLCVGPRWCCCRRICTVVAAGNERFVLLAALMLLLPPPPPLCCSGRQFCATAAAAAAAAATLPPPCHPLVLGLTPLFGCRRRLSRR